MIKAMALVAVYASACGRFDFASNADRAGSDGGAGSDGSAGSDAPVAQPCGAIAQMADNFDDGVADPKWQVGVAPSMTLVEDSGSLHVTYAANTAGLAYSKYLSVDSFSLAECAMTSRFVQTPSSTPGPEMAMCLSSPSNAELCVNFSNGQLVASFNDGVVDAFSQVYDPVADAHLRVRAQGSDFIWETSPDGQSWSVFHTRPTPIDLTNVRVDLFAGTSQSTAAPGEARFDDLAFSRVP